MTQQTTKHGRLEQPADIAWSTSLGSAWQRFCDELDARLLARFGVAFRETDGSEPDPDVLADLAFERALMR